MTPNVAVPSCRWCGRCRPGPFTPDQCRACWLAQDDPLYAAAREAFVRGLVTAETPPPPPADGPGTELKNLLAALGLNARSGCDCEARAGRMNAWGVAGCEARRDEIVAWLRAEYARLGWGTVLAAAVRTVRTDLAFTINPLDPAGSLFEEALRRAKAKAAGLPGGGGPH